MLKIIKKNFNVRDFVERFIGVTLSATAMLWMSCGEYTIGGIVFVLSLIDPRWFDDE